MAKKRVFEADIVKTGFDIVLKIKIASEIEEYFKKIAQKKNPADFIETSSVWLNEQGQGLKFYIKDEKLSDKVPSYQVFDNFGSGLIKNDKINLALLRTVDASFGITIKTDELLSLEEAKLYITQLADWTRDFYELELRDHIITSKISLETDGSHEQ